MKKDFASVPRLFALLAVSLLIAGLIMLGVLSRAHPVHLSVYLPLMMVAAILSEHFAPIIRGHSASISLPLAVAAMALQGPVAAAVVAGVSALRRDSLSSLRLFVVTVFNLGQYLTIFCISGMAYVELGGPLLDAGTVRQFTLRDFPQSLVPMMVAVLVCAVGNVLVTAVGISTLYRASLKATVRDISPYGASLLALGFVGYLMAQVVSSNPFALPLFLFPLMLARQVYQRYADLDDAYLDTVRSLIGALEAKDPYTRGHSERVAEYALKLGKALGKDERTLQMLETSALLHDIGKISLASDLLTKRERLDDTEILLMREHPIKGADMVVRIPPLKSLGEPIRRHHEWFDGSGYPDGMTGPEMPLIARVLALADAYDAMTTDRPYRPAMSPSAAADELIRCAGVQFDPSLTELFVSVVLPACVDWGRPRDSVIVRAKPEAVK